MDIVVPDNRSRAPIRPLAGSSASVIGSTIGLGIVRALAKPGALLEGCGNSAEIEALLGASAVLLAGDAATSITGAALPVDRGRPIQGAVETET